jgi:hypothetical protein
VVSFVYLLDFGTVPTVWHNWFFIFILDFETVPTVWHYYFVYGTLMLLRQCGIICLSMGFGTFPRVWHYWFFIFILNFGTDSVSIIWFSMGIWNYSHSVALSVFLLELIRESGMIGFSMRLWNSTDSVPLFVFLLYF